LIKKTARPDQKNSGCIETLSWVDPKRRRGYPKKTQKHGEIHEFYFHGNFQSTTEADASKVAGLHVEYAEQRIKYGILFTVRLFYEYITLAYV